MDSDPVAQQRMDLILKVRGGTLTAVEAARQLGVSRKTYYKWEARALGAMLEAVSDRGVGGRPPLERDEEKDELAERLAELETQAQEQEQAARVREMLAGAVKKNA